MLADRSYDRLDASGSSSGRGGGSPRPARSTWPHSRDYDPDIPLYIKLRIGLVSAEHRLGLNEAVFLYLYLQSNCYFTGSQAGTSVATYTHVDAAKHFRVTTRQVKRWMETLIDGGYVTTLKVNHGLIVTITKYGQEPPSMVKPSDISGKPSDISGQLMARDAPEPSDINGKPSDTGGHFVASSEPEPSDTSGKPSDTSGQLMAPDAPEPSDISGKPSDISGKPSDISGQPLIYVACAALDSLESLDHPTPLPPIVPHFFRGASLPRRGASLPGLVDAASATGLSELPETEPPVLPIPIPATLSVSVTAEPRVAPRRPSPSPWGLVTADPPVIDIPQVVSPPVSQPVSEPVSRPKRIRASRAKVKVVTVPEPLASEAVPEPAPMAIVLSRPVAVSLPDADARPGASVTVLDRDGQVIVPDPGTAIAVVVQALPAVPPVRNPTKIGHIIDLLRAANLPDALSPQDMRAIKGSALTPEQLVACFGSLFLHEWGTTWDWEHLDMAYAIRKWVPYQQFIRSQGGKVAQLQDLLDAAFVVSDLTAAETAAVLRSSLTAEEIAQAYLGLHKGTWGSDYNRSRIGVIFVIENFAKYEVSLRKRDRDPTAKRTRDEQTEDAWAIQDRLLAEGKDL